MTRDETWPIAAYAVADRDMCDFIDMVREQKDKELLRILWLMLITENPQSDMALNKLAAGFIRPVLERKGVDLSPLQTNGQ